MSVFPERRAFLTPRETSDGADAQPLLPAMRSPVDWARRRRADKELRRIEAAGSRAAHRLDHLGPSWHVVDLPRTDTATPRWLELDSQSRPERAGFLAIGPSGVFAVTVADHGRARVLVAGDVVQISGRRPPYVVQARKEAKRASKALSAAVGTTVPVVPVLAFVGTGVISVYGLPRDIVVAPHRELDRLLVAGGERISATTAEKLTGVARHPSTWGAGTSRSSGESYRWYGDGQTAADKRRNPR